MRKQDKQVNEYFVSWAFDFKVFKENVDSKYFEGLVDNVFALRSSEKGSWAIYFGSNGYDGESAGVLSIELFVVLAMDGLNNYDFTICVAYKENYIYLVYSSVG